MANNLHLLVLEKIDFGFMFKNSFFFFSFARILVLFFFFFMVMFLRLSEEFIFPSLADPKPFNSVGTTMNITHPLCGAWGV